MHGRTLGQGRRRAAGAIETSQGNGFDGTVVDVATGEADSHQGVVELDIRIMLAVGGLDAVILVLRVHREQDVRLVHRVGVVAARIGSGRGGNRIIEGQARAVMPVDVGQARNSGRGIRTECDVGAVGRPVIISAFKFPIAACLVIDLDVRHGKARLIDIRASILVYRCRETAQAGAYVSVRECGAAGLGFKLIHVADERGHHHGIPVVQHCRNGEQQLLRSRLFGRPGLG